MLDQATRNSLYPRFREACGEKQLDAPNPAFRWLGRFITRTSGAELLSCRMLDDGLWWVMFRLDIQHPKVWHVIQQLSHVCYGRFQGVSLPVRFFPFSTTPENGGPDQMLLWRIECYDAAFTPDTLVAELGTYVSRSITPWPPKIGQSAE